MIELNELQTLKINVTDLGNTIEFLFGYGYQVDKYYILEYRENRDAGKLSDGMSFEEAHEKYENIIKEDNAMSAMVDSLFDIK